MAKLTHRIELTIHDRDLILKYGYVSDRLEASLRRWPKDQMVRRVGMDRVELRWLISDLTHSCNKAKTGQDLDAVVELCEHLECAHRTGDGDSDFW